MLKDYSDSERGNPSFLLAVSVLLYAPSHRQDITYHGLCYTGRGALAGTRNSAMCPFDQTTHRTISGHGTPIIRLAPLIASQSPLTLSFFIIYVYV